ncbi:uncharacterized protein CTHT_0025890 [Thermochaetoides thermophila DSM 1495]|uniref:25S rRNA (uridine-N(3))-methyltransferase BMT5-like domain-containing protein n=1 Tax=Chaetomium thermophilum (strain DSM 1495 / CBS 144.50 / IMI 039719) TaxID=759272 RepID=G0S689_CHATD|nr:hypothetical protein CTHT_0025890 [Thermochaetoides thermophila DSM 1495]EGS20753.1 hypothetical protein CTHT_0025890 [Thermochaetoides thermophila DSM 1495]
MGKARGLLKNAAKAVKQQHRANQAQKNQYRSQHQHQNPKNKPFSRPPPSKKQKTTHSKDNAASKHSQQQYQTPTLPFHPSDTILLVGEGDLSFAASLVTHHKCTNVTATVLEKDLAELSAKYPHVAQNISVIESSPQCRVMYGVNARKLPLFRSPSAPKKQPKRPYPDDDDDAPPGTMKRIIFNFPHVGGKSTDVNRQVRYNQELLVDFFRSAQPSLAPGGCIVVTLFEGEPYTLWNIRDLARHTGLQVERSFKFMASAYPGYAHARTLGVVKNKKGEVAKAAWKGEERPARSYVFVRKGEDSGLFTQGKKRKRSGGASDESESEGEGQDGQSGSEVEDTNEIENDGDDNDASAESEEENDADEGEQSDEEKDDIQESTVDVSDSDTDDNETTDQGKSSLTTKSKV